VEFHGSEACYRLRLIDREDALRYVLANVDDATVLR